jgi:hypothetical protein
MINETCKRSMASPQKPPKPIMRVQLSRPDLTDENQSKLSLLKEYHLDLLQSSAGYREDTAIEASPAVTADILDQQAERDSPSMQYGLIAGISKVSSGFEHSASGADPRLFVNVSAPSSTFICGSQGSGKSHTLSCLLEKCLIKSDASELRTPLTGLVFHYDTFFSDLGGSPCEAAFLSSNASLKVRVLCALTNIRTIKVNIPIELNVYRLTVQKQTYHSLNVQVEPIRLDQDDLNTKRMLDLMAVNPEEGSVPLYIHTVNRILREMRLSQQENGSRFDYREFKKMIN